MSPPLTFAPGDRCSFEGAVWRVEYVAADRRSALISRGGRFAIVATRLLDLACGGTS